MSLPKHYVTGTHPQYLKKFAHIIELHYGYGMSYKAIAIAMEMPKSNVQHICNKYKPTKGDRDITVLIESQINKETQP